MLSAWRCVLMDSSFSILIASLLLNSVIACAFLFLVPQDATNSRGSSIIYFRRYFVYSCVAYVSFGIRDFIPDLLSIFVFNGFLLASAYSVLLGAMERYAKITGLVKKLGMSHILLFALVQTALGYFYPHYTVIRVVLVYVNMTGVLLYTLSLFMRFNGKELYSERLLGICLAVFTLSIFLIPVAFFASNDQSQFPSIMMLVQNALIILLFGAFFYTFSIDAIRQLEGHVKIDLMTGLYNRNFFIEQAHKFVKSAQRHQFPITVVLCDLDNFRALNNSQSHLAGDKAILHVAERLKGATRDEDILARFSGEEFIALLPQTQLDSAVHLAERLRQNIGDTPIQFEENSFHITASFGVTTMNSKVDVEASLKLVNKALCESMEKGGNCVTVA